MIEFHKNFRVIDREVVMGTHATLIAFKEYFYQVSLYKYYSGNTLTFRKNNNDRIPQKHNNCK